MTPVDITRPMQDFKESSRHLWNAYLCRGGNRASLPTIEAFERIERDLLRELVLRGVGAPDAAEAYRLGPMTSIVVQANASLSDIPLHHGEPQQNGHVQWTAPATFPVARLPRLAFFDFFDWDPYVRRDFGFVRAIDRDTGQGVLLRASDVVFQWVGE